MNAARTIYLFPGLDKEFPIFGRISENLAGSIIVDYPAPYLKEPLSDYARRIADSLTANSVLIGVSFGGILAQEVSKILNPKGCIVIASVKEPRELPPSFRLARLIGGDICSSLLSVIGRTFCNVPHRIRPRWIVRLNKLSGSNGEWHRWALAAILNWTPSKQEFSCPILQIHGSEDTTFPSRYTKPDILIPGGRHSLPVSHPKEILNSIVLFLDRISNTKGL